MLRPKSADWAAEACEQNAGARITKTEINRQILIDTGAANINTLLIYYYYSTYIHP
jgi:hypothetical protein